MAEEPKERKVSEPWTWGKDKMPDFTLDEPKFVRVKRRKGPSPARVRKSAAEAAARQARLAARKRPVWNRQRFTLEMANMREQAARPIADIAMENRMEAADREMEMWSRQIDMDEMLAKDMANLHRRIELIVQQYELTLEGLADVNMA